MLGFDCLFFAGPGFVGPSVDWTRYLYLQIKNGFQFESETDTEIIPKLLKMIHDTRKDDDLTFRELVERAIQQLVSYCQLIQSFFVSLNFSIGHCRTVFFLCL